MNISIHDTTYLDSTALISSNENECCSDWTDLDALCRIELLCLT